MKVYLLLFVLGFANEGLLTLYYTLAAKGQRWKCVGISLAHQLVACTATFMNIVDVEPGSREQFLRWTITALSFGAATAFVVRPPKEVER